jgi:hypothetical protein
MLFRVGPLPGTALEAAAEFYARVLPIVLAQRVPPRTGEDLVLVFDPASYDHRPWRLAAIQDLARAVAPARANGIVGDDEAAVAEVLAFLEGAPGVTGQLFAA